jgi:hypothetical protein
MFHRWAGGKATLLKIHDDHPSISLTHPITGITNVIPIKERDGPHRALGWMMMIDGKSTGPFNTLEQKAQQLASTIYGSRMRRQDASLAYNCYYIAIIGYTLAVTKMAVNQCDAIQIPVVCATLNKMDINRNVARKIVFGPKTLVGLEMHYLYTIQGTKRLQYFLGHVICNDINSNLMRFCMESTQLEVGTYEPFLFLNYKMAGSHLFNKTWLTAIWEHLSLSNGTITTTNPWLPQPQIEHDTSLMAIALSSNFTKKQKQHINACRIQLQTISISDISTFDGNSITHHAHDVKREDTASSLRCPNQQRPPKSWWNT